MNLIIIQGFVYNASINDVKKLKFIQDKWRIARDNESNNEESINDELYRLELQVIKRSQPLGVVKYRD